MSTIPFDSVRSQYEALTRSAGVFDMGRRTQIELTGRDRVSFLHGLCTNDIKRLMPGGGCEAFLTNSHGKTVGYAYVFRRAESLVLETSPGQATTILRGLDRFIIREDVQLHDRSDTWGELLLSGRDAERCLHRSLHVELPAPLFSHVETQWQGQSLTVARVPFAGPSGFFITCPAGQTGLVRSLLEQSGAAPCTHAAVEIVRIEAGSPVYGVDVTDKNLPQEVDRNDVAVSFTKGCYLGQETIARLKAMGHVNRIFRGLKFPGEHIPSIGLEIEADGKVVAAVTSAAWSFRLAAPFALAHVRRGCDEPGRKLSTSFGEAEVMALPLRPERAALQ